MPIFYRDFKILVFDVQKEKSHNLLIKEDFFYKFLRKIDYNYQELIKFLVFKDDQLLFQIEKVHKLNHYNIFISLKVFRKNTDD